MNDPGSKTPDSLHPRAEAGILSKVLVDEGVLIAEARAQSLIEKARFNEAIKVIEELEREVSDMVMPQKFSRIKKPAESPNNRGTSNASLMDLTEDEYKRQILLMSLSSLKQSIQDAVSNLNEVVLDIEATKQ